MLTKIIYKNFRSNLKNYILFFLSNIVAIMELFVFRGLKEIVLQIVKDTETAFLFRIDFTIALGMISVIMQIPLHRITDSASNGSVFPVVTEHFSASSDHAFL